MKNPLETPGTTILLGLVLTAALYGALRMTAPATIPAETTAPGAESSIDASTGSADVAAPAADEAATTEAASGAVVEPATP